MHAGGRVRQREKEREQISDKWMSWTHEKNSCTSLSWNGWFWALLATWESSDVPRGCPGAVERFPWNSLEQLINHAQLYWQLVVVFCLLHGVRFTRPHLIRFQNVPPRLGWETLIAAPAPRRCLIIWCVAYQKKKFPLSFAMRTPLYILREKQPSADSNLLLLAR